MSNEDHPDLLNDEARVLGQPAAGQDEGLSLPPRPDVFRPRAGQPRARADYTPDYVPPEEDDAMQERGMGGSPYTPEEEALTTTPRRSSLPVIVAAIISLIVIVGTILATVLSTALDSGDKLPGSVPLPVTSTVTPDPAKAADMLNRSVQAMKAVHTLHYTSDAGFYGMLTSSEEAVSSTGAISLTLSGDVKLPDSYTMNTNMSQVGQYVVISDTTWSRRNNNPSWVSQPSSEIGLGPVNPLAVILYLQDYKQGTQQEVGTERADGVLLHHIHYKVDTGKLATDEPGQATQDALSRSSIDADAWVRDKDYLLDRMSLSVDSGDGKAVSLRTFFSKYNETVSVVPPQNVSP